ncbi:maltose alpha-D-glucosyltransferase [Legionella jordanis]|uniref:maltose alpha-D-glucosyltransferase n=1 Tax=Legionella jordanis TaxID=456 RepID=A0A0W0VB59_9GAMM|nr:maltose alpha-D-glucosyltransferase [Legionella jordanis]KTD17126.1 Trehalose synthase/amylase TreS [Legionella jordanis]VEH12677.1 Trehalose synthase/amylase TreS [Legionella jordanis]
MNEAMTLDRSQSDWYKDAVIYQVHIRSFFDSNADGIGDLRGLIEKLDYLKFLGITAIWLLPFYPSPLKDEGYDIADYLSINPIYGNIRDFKTLLKEAHKRGIKIITELVINHTSNEHPWFQKSRTSKPGSYWRNFYTWSDSAKEYSDARIIFRDFETSNWAWDPVAKAYYWHRFYSHQPDLNYDNPNVQKEIFKIVDFWLSMGVDGLRLDAIPYLFQREGTSCENLPETHEFLKRLSAHVQQHFNDRFLLAEANQWPDEAVKYFGNGDECQMAFHFPLMPRLYMAIQMENSFPIIDIIEQTPSIPDNCQWATFLRNHDELTLEMVTDEERDYMYRMYAQDEQMRINLGIRRRLAPLMGGDRQKIELMNVLLFSMPGTPIIYYGDEIGMGDNIYLGDRNSVRTPMQWSADSNAGFSKSTPQKLYSPVIIDPEYNYQAINVQLQQQNFNSLLWWMKHIIEIRQTYKAFSRGSIQFLDSNNNKILAFLRTYQEQSILVLINLSRNIQPAWVQLPQYQGYMPQEILGKAKFPAIDEKPYFLVLASYGFLWLELHKNLTKMQKGAQNEYWLEKRISELYQKPTRKEFETNLLTYLIESRWFRSKTYPVRDLVIEEIIPVLNKPVPIHFLMLLLSFEDKEPERYFIFVTFDTIPPANSKYLCAIHLQEAIYYVADLAYTPALWKTVFELLASKHRFKGSAGTLEILPGSQAKKVLLNESNEILQEPVNAEQSNTTIRFSNCAQFKLYRRVEFGSNPEAEITEVLTKSSEFRIPAMLSKLEYHYREKLITVGLVQEFIANKGDAWTYSVNTLNNLIDQNPEFLTMPAPPNEFLSESNKPIPEDIYHTLGVYAPTVELLAKRTAEMHEALANASTSPSFKKENFSLFDQRSLYQTMRSVILRAKKQFKLNVEEDLKEQLKEILQDDRNLLEEFKPLLTKKIGGKKIRCHGDYHLGQILYTGNDFVIIDYEGEPARPISERKIKRSPLRDVAGMLRSFHYAIYNVLELRKQDLAFQKNSPEHWYQWTCQLFLQNYLSYSKIKELLPLENSDIYFLLKIFMLEKVFYEIEYEMNNRPDWLRVPCIGLINLME